MGHAGSLLELLESGTVVAEAGGSVQINEGLWLCSDKTLFIDTDMRSCNFHMS